MLLTRLLLEHPSALGDIIRGTPPWVGALLALLILLGLSAARTRHASLVRVLLTPVAMGALALWGVVSAFAGGGQVPMLLAVWLLSGGAVLLLGRRAQTAPSGARWDPALRRFELPGSWVPMLLILAVFLMKYGIGVQLAMAPHLAHERAFAVIVSALYGALSGLFAARTLRVLRLARPATAG